jgi:hypothetical protein
MPLLFPGLQTGHGPGAVAQHPLRWAPSQINHTTLQHSLWPASSTGRPKGLPWVVNECDPEGSGIDVSLLEHVSPIEWDNVVLYGIYVLNPKLVRRSARHP